MPQDFFEPRTPVSRKRAAGISVGRDAAREPGRTGTPQGGAAPARPRAAADERTSAAPAADRPARPQPGAPQPPGPPRDEPSWLRIYWNTLRSFTRRRLGMKPRPVPGADAPGGGRRPLFVVLAVVVAAALLTTAVVVLTRGGGTDADRATGPSATGAPAGGPTGGGPTGAAGFVTPPQVRDAAAAWVVGHVGAGRVVACDAGVCGALAALGFPASATVLVQDTLTGVQSADVVVLTPTLRAQLGTAVEQVTAPEPLAAFGPGDGTATVVAVAHAGRAAYARAAAADRAERRSAGAELLANPRLKVPAEARVLLAGGQVDMRICALLATLGTGHTLTVASFGAPVPGAGLGIARSELEISVVDGQPAAGPSAQATALRTLIAAQQAPYRPLSTTPEPGASAPTTPLTVRYSQPAPPATDTASAS